MRIVKEGKIPGDPRPYFMFAREGVETYYREGANILWLRFVHDLPESSGGWQSPSRSTGTG